MEKHLYRTQLEAHTTTKTIGVMIMFIGILLVSLCSAQLTFQKDKEINLRIPVDIEGAMLSSSGTCEINLKYPNSSYMINNQTMDNLGNGEFEINITAGQNKELGEHKWNMFCVDNFNNGSGDGIMLVTPSGNERINSGEGISLLTSVLTLFLAGAFFFGLSFLFEGIAGKIIFVGLAAVMLIIAVLNSLLILTQNLGGFTAFIETYSTIWLVIKVLTSISVLALVIFSLIISFRLWQYKRGFID